ncbi:MAG TPA: HAMP domain-containing sensor histidine kinase, partial [Burkholderiales bacterium]|nr:HAMP domain-containing sensor histidine kinase [Burkholderiales bacterium]
AMIRTRWRFNVQIVTQVVWDILFVTVLLYASRGVSSGLGLLLLTTLAGAGLISRGKLALFFAALASIAVLLEHGYEVLIFQESPGQFIQVGFLSIGYFATALVAHTLAQLTRQNEQIAAQRAIDVANLSEVNRLVIRDMPDGVIVVDGGGVVRQVNTRAEAFLGVLRGRENMMLIDYAPTLAAHLARWRAGTADLWSGYVASMDERHGLRFVPVGAQPDAGTVIFLEDLTRVREQAQQMKLAAIGRLTANIAHEIRNPLGSISHAAQLLHEEPESSPGTRRLLGIIHDNTQRLNRMVNDVLGLNRGQAALLETIRVGEFVRQFVAEFAETEKAAIDIFSVRADSTLQIMFDRTHLNQVLWNLCRNALRHCRGNAGSVQIVAQRVRGSRVVKLDVIDDGPGVPPQVRSGLFEPFVTTAPGGTGLGLYIAREVCAANGAALDYVESSAGAQFTLTCRAGG